ncbi:zinc ribbon domain-containing protein [Thomasclavelia sp.]|uniref:zinc ribbon domain-containing protein n=1 Tax=Thomasclavelia sp. TaxID=3025757 RepID=UPI0025F7C68A|nr:zinc ribbon domain-containing protein [Thomasclavelia sp.]
MICKQCGKEIEDNARFCPECGAAVENSNAASGNNFEQTTANIQDKVDGFTQNMKQKEVEISGKKFNMLEVVTFASTIIAIVACFLPFISVSYYSLSLMDAGKDAIIFIVLAVGASVLTYLRQDLPAMCVSIVTAVYLFMEYTDVKDTLGSYASLSMGFYLMLLAVAGLIISTLLVYLDGKKQMN